jgi:endo-1,4-beta-D-glucanase Y
MEQLLQQHVDGMKAVTVMLLILPLVFAIIIQALKAWDKYLTNKENEQAKLAQQQNNDA